MGNIPTKQLKISKELGKLGKITKDKSAELVESNDFLVENSGFSLLIEDQLKQTRNYVEIRQHQQQLKKTLSQKLMSYDSDSRNRIETSQAEGPSLKLMFSGIFLGVVTAIAVVSSLLISGIFYFEKGNSQLSSFNLSGEQSKNSVNDTTKSPNKTLEVNSEKPTISESLGEQIKPDVTEVEKLLTELSEIDKSFDNLEIDFTDAANL